MPSCRLLRLKEASNFGKDVIIRKEIENRKNIIPNKKKYNNFL